MGRVLWPQQKTAVKMHSGHNVSRTTCSRQDNNVARNGNSLLPSFCPAVIIIIIFCYFRAVVPL